MTINSYRLVALEEQHTRVDNSALHSQKGHREHQWAMNHTHKQKSCFTSKWVCVFVFFFYFFVIKILLFSSSIEPQGTKCCISNTEA